MEVFGFDQGAEPPAGHTCPRNQFDLAVAHPMRGEHLRLNIIEHVRITQIVQREGPQPFPLPWLPSVLR